MANDMTEFLSSLRTARRIARSNVVDYRTLEMRTRPINKVESRPGCRGVLYWIVRDHRIQDNWAVVIAQRKAMDMKVPLYVCYCLSPDMKESTVRHLDFMIGGLKEVSQECCSLNIGFCLLNGLPENEIPKLIRDIEIDILIVDFSPLKPHIQWIEAVNSKIKIPFYQVDAHNIIPCWIASQKQEVAARTLRPQINFHKKFFFVEFPELIAHPFKPRTLNEISWDSMITGCDFIDSSVESVTWAQPGSICGLTILFEFCNMRLRDYSDLRNNPTADALSHLSPWMHFGQISPQRVILEVSRFHNKFPTSVDKFIDECWIWRELADNFCFYNINYDKIEGAPKWAIDTLTKHSMDKRSFLYSAQDFEKGHTHDSFWNAAQNQLLSDGKIHGYVRMYWAKKMLEWSLSPADAINTAIYLNDKYSLDGSDPNGYAGIMWSICGSHDNQFPERPIYGTVRCMTQHGLERKFDYKAYIRKYSGKKSTSYK